MAKEEVKGDKKKGKSSEDIKPVKKTEAKEAKPKKTTEAEVKEEAVEEKPKKVKATGFDVDVKKLLESGAHFGHQTQRWNPKMAEFIYTKRNNVHIIDLFKTAEKLNEALSFISKASAEGSSVLFVGTKNQAKDIIKEVAESTNSPYINEKWLGGMLTNFSTVAKRIRYIAEQEQRVKDEKFVTKKEKLDAEVELKKLNANFGGIRQITKIPEILFIVDSHKEKNAIKEAKKLGLKIVAIVDTNADPSEVDYVIPANDDAIKAIKYITELVGQAIVTGKGKIEA